MKKKSIFYKPDFEKKYKRMRVILLLFIVLFAGFIYMNYDYLVFKFFISYNYAYTDTLDKLYIETISEENVKGYFRNFDDMTIAAVSEKIRSIDNDRYTYLYTPKQYTIKKEYDKAVVEEASVKELSPDVVYIYIPSISKYTKEFVYNNIDTLSAYKNIVIDLRSDTGGDLNAMYKMADLFVEKGVTLGYEKTRNTITSRHIKSSGAQKLVYDHIIILQNASTASACEGFTMALKENLSNVTIMGETSYGKGIGQYTIPLKSGFAVKATTMQIQTPLGNSIHGVGIPADVEYMQEDILDYAVKYIAEN